MTKNPIYCNIYWSKFNFLSSTLFRFNINTTMLFRLSIYIHKRTAKEYINTLSKTSNSIGNGISVFRSTIDKNIFHKINRANRKFSRFYFNLISSYEEIDPSKSRENFQHELQTRGYKTREIRKKDFPRIWSDNFRKLLRIIMRQPQWNIKQRERARLHEFGARITGDIKSHEYLKNIPSRHGNSSLSLSYVIIHFLASL